MRWTFSFVACWWPVSLGGRMVISQMISVGKNQFFVVSASESTALAFLHRCIQIIDFIEHIARLPTSNTCLESENFEVRLFFSCSKCTPLCYSVLLIFKYLSLWKPPSGMANECTLSVQNQNSLRILQLRENTAWINFFIITSNSGDSLLAVAFLLWRRQKLKCTGDFLWFGII